MAGWPKKNEELRIYRDKDRKTYFIIFVPQNEEEEKHSWRHGFDAIANVYNGPEPSLVHTMIGRNYISDNWLKRMQWDEVPKNYREAFTEYMNRGEGEPFDPAKYRGLWRVGNQPTPLLDK